MNVLFLLVALSALAFGDTASAQTLLGTCNGAVGVVTQPNGDGNVFCTPRRSSTQMLMGNCIGTVEIMGKNRKENVSCTPTPPPPPPITVSLFSAPLTINAGQSSTLTWSSTNATSCTASGSWSGAKAISGSQVVSPSATSTYILTCSGAGGSAQGSADVIVMTFLPTVFLSAMPTAISVGQSSTLTWFSTNATTCTASGAWNGAKTLNGAMSVSPPATSTYTLTCSGVGGSAVASASVNVGN